MSRPPRAKKVQSTRLISREVRVREADFTSELRDKTSAIAGREYRSRAGGQGSQ